MAKAKEKKPGKGKGESPKEPGCDLEGPAPSAPVAGLAGILESVRASRYLQVLLVLTILGAFLRLFQLGAASLWLDEASTLTFARESVTQIWGSLSSATEFHPPLFYWMEHAMLAFGDGEVVLRIIPAIFGILTIPVFYLLGAEILDRNTGLLAAALLTFSPFQIYYSQEARDYAMMLFFFSLAFLFFLRLLRSWGRRDALLFGVFSALAFWAHFYAFVPIVALLIFVLAVKAKEMARDPRSAIPLVISILVFSLLTLPLIYYAVQLFGKITGSAPTFGTQGIQTISLTFMQISGFSEILAYAFVVLFVLGAASLFTRDRMRATLLVFAIVGPLLLSIFLSYRMPMNPRYLIYLLAAFLPGIALLIRPACSLFRSRNLVYGALILALVINLPVLVPYYTTQQKDDWRGASRELTGLAAPGDLVVAIPGYVHQPLDYYYGNETAGTLQFGLYTVGDVQGLIASYPGRQVWFIVTGDIQATDTQGLLISWLGSHTRLTWRDSNGGILLLRYTG
ncbi:MAG: glycosyltransferase family 39 protein [Methanomicrobiales archaeon]